MAFTQQQIDDLRAAIAEGVRTVSSAGRTVTYASTAEMLQVLRMMEADVAAAAVSDYVSQRRTLIEFHRD